MGLLDDFELVDSVSGIPSVSITKNGISFNKSTIEKLHCPEHVKLYLDRIGKRFAIVPCNKGDNGYRAFYRKEKDTANGVRWNNYDLRTTIAGLTGWNLEEHGWKICGLYSEEDNALIFDLNKAEPLSRRK